MSSSVTSYNNTSDSIDFDFFENEDCLTKVYSKQKQSDSSKFITKAVIETEPVSLDFPEGAIIDNHSGQRFDRPVEERLSQYRKQSDCLSSPSPSLERKLLGLGLDDAALETLMNCLAYNDERFDNLVSSSPYSFDLKESSDNSLTDSTVTTITSDFTCISPLLSSSCDSLSDDENSAVNDSNPQSEGPTNSCVLDGDFKQEQSSRPTNDETVIFDELKENDETASLKGPSDCDDSDQNLDSQDDKNCNSPEAYESDFESYNETKYLEKNCESGKIVVKNVERLVSLSDKESHVSTLEDELGDISISQSRSSSVKTSYKKKKNCNLTFKREELIRIERDNLILLKKIMAHSKHKPVSLNQQPFSHKKTSTAINRAKQQKKIEQDNYVSRPTVL